MATKSIKKRVTFVNNQYNSPIGLYSPEQIAETIDRHTQLLNDGALGVDFKLAEAPHLRRSEVLKMLAEEEQQQQHNGHRQQQSPWQFQQQQQQQHFARQDSGDMVKVAWPPVQQQQQQQQQHRSHTTSESSSVTRRYEYSSYERRSESLERDANKPVDMQTDQHRYLLEQKMQRLREQELQQQQTEAARAKSSVHRDLPPVPPPRSQPDAAVRAEAEVVVRAEPAVVREEQRVREIPVERQLSTDNQSSMIQDVIESYIVQEPKETRDADNTSCSRQDSTTITEPIMFKATAEVIEASLRASGRIRRGSESDRYAHQNQQSSENQRKQPPSTLNVRNYHGMASRRVPEPFASNELIGERPIVAKPAPPPGLVLTSRPIRREPPFSQQGAPVVRAEPFFRRGTTPVRMLGDMVWPPKAAVMNERPKSVPPKSPGTIRRQQKDYKPFFTQNQLPPSFPMYRAPPGTQHYGLMEGENPTPM